MPIVILDTNVFLQYRDLRELPWTELVGKGRVNLLIPLTVQRELERHKADGNSRRSTRARKTIPLFRQLVHSREESVLLDGTSDVRVKLMRLRRLDAEKYPELDLNAPDQRIIAEILRAIEDGLEEVPILATADTFLCGVAKQFDVRFVELPDEWRLPEEPDSRGKELKELRSRVERLEGNRPLFR
ncbi:PIN domain-containing protein [Cupriavidus basilensis]|uniref:PIN domain-containing protein n=1 Tax=Cupriavidus basilensis TaxID=68895 RepID=UPI0039F704B1